MRQRYSPPDVFPAGEANVRQAMYRSLERSPQDTRDGFDLYSAQASFAGRALTSSHRLSAFLEYIGGFEFIKVGFASLAGKASFICISDDILLLRS